MGSGSTRGNTAEDKMISSIERGRGEGFVDRKPTRSADQKLVQQKQKRTDEANEQLQKLKALRLAAEKEAKTSK